MPFEGSHENDIGLETANGPICIHDVKDGRMKSPEEIFNGGVEFYATAITNGNKDLAVRLTRRNMKTLPYWQSHHFDMLDGEEATDEEYASSMAKL